MNKVLFIMPLLMGAAFAQPQISTVVGAVKDSRTTGNSFAELVVEVKLVGDDLDTAKFLRSKVERAKDDTGRDLVKPSDDVDDFDEISSGDTPKIDLKLKNPARRSIAIATIEGEITLFVPGNDPDATVRIADFKKNPGSEFSSSAFKSNKIQITYWTKELAEAEKLKQQAKKDDGTLESTMVNAFAQMFQGLMRGGPNDVTLQIKDPDNRIVRIEFEDAAGKKISSGGRSTSRNEGSKIVSYQFSQPVADDARLVVLVGTDKSLVKLPLSLKNVALP